MPDEIISLSIYNEYATSQFIAVDDVMIRPKQFDISFRDGSLRFINNRYLKMEQ